MRQANALDRAQTVDRLVFEALFVEALRPRDAVFLAELRRAGFDPSYLQPEYPLDVFVRCLEVARRRLFGDRPPDGAFRALGHALADGAFSVKSLRLLGVALPMFGPERCLESAVCWTWLGALRFSLAATRERPGSCRLDLAGPDDVPAELLAGVVERVLEKGEVHAQVEIGELRPSAFTLRVSWSPA